MSMHTIKIKIDQWHSGNQSKLTMNCMYWFWCIFSILNWCTFRWEKGSQIKINAANLNRYEQGKKVIHDTNKNLFFFACLMIFLMLMVDNQRIKYVRKLIKKHLPEIFDSRSVLTVFNWWIFIWYLANWSQPQYHIKKKMLDTYIYTLAILIAIANCFFSSSTGSHTCNILLIVY